MTEVYFRNPHNYIRELVEVPTARKVIWDRGILVKRSLDPLKHAKLYFGAEADFEILVCGDQGTAHLDKDHDLSNPLAVYPTWVYDDDTLTHLEEWIENPIGEDFAACSDMKIPTDERPVLGQDHRIILTNLPMSRTAASKHLLRNIREILEDAEQTVKLHVHGLYGYSDMFGKGFYSTDFDARIDASKGRVVLPNGKRVTYERATNTPGWVGLLDMKMHDLKEPRMRCIFNIKSALWAGENFDRDLKFKTVGKVNVDPTDPVVRDHRGARVVTGRSTPQPGDKVACNSCSLQDNCKFYRENAVCSLPESETSALVNYFKSRDSDRIIDALGTLLGAQAGRLEKAVEDEEYNDEGTLDPEVTKMFNALFKNGVALAKLINPALSKPGVQINMGNAAQVAAASPQQLVSRAVKALEDQGVAREDITGAMIENMLGQFIQQSDGQPQPTEPVIIQGQLES